MSFAAKSSTLREEESISESSSDVPSRPLLPLEEISYFAKQPSFPSYCVISLSAARTLEEQTRNQWASKRWKKERSFRLTASNFGCIVKRRKEVNESFLMRLRGGGHWKGNRYTRAGTNNESHADDKYRSSKSVLTFSVGFCVNPGCPIIGASPDRLVYDTDLKQFGLLEIKTLAKAKELNLSVREAMDSRKTPCCLKRNEEEGIYLDKNHDYYYQVQGQLGVTGLPWCDFFVDAGNDFFCQRILFDQVFFDSMLKKLVSFYFEHFAEE